MKKIEAYLKPFRLAEVRNALARERFDVIRVHDAEELRPAEKYTEVVRGWSTRSTSRRARCSSCSWRIPTSTRWSV